MMRILVGVIHSAENELEECLESIHSQEGCHAEVFVISGLGKSEAHLELYSTFMNRHDECDLFMKVDADMVIEDDHFFLGIAEFFAQNCEIDELQIPVFDAFTRQDVYGLCTYRSSVKWDVKERDAIFTDYGAKSVNRHKDSESFRGVISHCRNPSTYQSWHFGLHKAIKFTQYERGSRFNVWASYIHWKNLVRIFELSDISTQNPQAIAKRGAADAIRHCLKSEHIDYANTLSHSLFKKAEKEQFRSNTSMWFPEDTSGKFTKSKFGLTLVLITLRYHRPLPFRKLRSAAMMTLRNRF